MLFWLTYRTWHVERAMIEAPNLEKAEALGRTWCATRSPRNTFVGVEPVVVARYEDFFPKENPQ